MKELILASGSARRRGLMENCGYVFEVIPSSAEEGQITESDPALLVEKLSALKAETVFRALPCERQRNAVVVGSDTVVAFGERILGKPVDEEDAASMLRMESGGVNVVYTGLALVSLNEAGGLSVTTVHDAARVRFTELTEEEIQAYIATGEPMDKAGAYGIQGRFSAFVEGVEGSYFTVVGLPVHVLYRELKKLGITPQS